MSTVPGLLDDEALIGYQIHGVFLSERQENMTRWAVALTLTVLMTGCSDSDKDFDAGVDTIAPDFTTAYLDGAPKANYPAGPYGTKAGETIANLEFLGYMDPKNFCKSPADKSLDTSRLRRISFQDYYKGDSGSGCSKYKPKLMWVMVSAGWCGPCKVEVSSTQAQYGKGAIMNGLELLNIVFETTTGAPSTGAFTKLWANEYKLSFPVVMDPSFKMGAYFSKAAVPFNMLVDAKTMKIYYQQVGGSLTNIGKKAAEFLAK